MHGLLLTLALLAAAPDTPDTPAASRPTQATLDDVTLAAPPFEAAQKMPKKDVTYFSDHFAQRLTANGVQVITTEKITSVREMEKLRQLAGCPATSADCIIELGHMLGAVGVLRGTIAKVGELYQVDVRVYQASDGKVIAARSASARSSESLVRALDQLAVETATLVKATFAPPKPQEKSLPMPPPPTLVQRMPPPPAPLDLRTVAWIPGVASLVTVAGGVGCLGVSQFMRFQIANGDPINQAAAEERAKQGRTLAWVGTGLAAAAGVAAGTWALFTYATPNKSSVTVTPEPAGVKVEVRFP